VDNQLGLAEEYLVRLVRPITMSLPHDRPLLLSIEYGDEAAALAPGVRWSPVPATRASAQGDGAQGYEVRSELFVTYWGLVRYCSTSIEEEVDYLLGRVGVSGGEARFELCHDVIGIGKAAVPGLLRLLDGTEKERTFALTCLEMLYAREAVPRIIPLLNNKRWGVLKPAIHTLGRLEDPRAVDALVELMHESQHDGIVAAAAGALGRIGDVRAVPVLEELLADAKTKRKMAAARALALMGRRDGLEAALAVAQTGDSGKSALQALWCLGGTEAQEALLGFAERSRKKSRQKQALLYAKLVGAREASPEERARVLGELFSRGTSIPRLMTVYEIERLQGDEALSVLKQLIATGLQQGDRESVSLLLSAETRLLARKAWKDHEAKGGEKGPEKTLQMRRSLPCRAMSSGSCGNDYRGMHHRAASFWHGSGQEYGPAHPGSPREGQVSWLSNVTRFEHRQELRGKSRKHRQQRKILFCFQNHCCAIPVCEVRESLCEGPTPFLRSAHTARRLVNDSEARAQP